MIEIQQATIQHLKVLHELFEQYREFYQMSRSENKSFHFLKSRLEKKDSFIWIGFDQQIAAGFIQVYPVFSSVAMQPLWILNDLYVSSKHRQKGIARKMVLCVEKTAKNNQVFSIKLATQVNNAQAKKLYYSLDYKVIEQFDHFSKKIAD